MSARGLAPLALLSFWVLIGIEGFLYPASRCNYADIAFGEWAMLNIACVLVGIGTAAALVEWLKDDLSREL